MEDILNEVIDFKESMKFIKSFEYYAGKLLKEEVKKMLVKEKTEKWAKAYTRNIIDKVEAVLRSSLS